MGDRIRALMAHRLRVASVEQLRGVRPRLLHDLKAQARASPTLAAAAVCARHQDEPQPRYHLHLAGADPLQPRATQPPARHRQASGAAAAGLLAARADAPARVRRALHRRQREVGEPPGAAPRGDLARAELARTAGHRGCADGAGAAAAAAVREAARDARPRLGLLPDGGGVEYPDREGAGLSADREGGARGERRPGRVGRAGEGVRYDRVWARPAPVQRRRRALDWQREERHADRARRDKPREDEGKRRAAAPRAAVCDDARKADGERERRLRQHRLRDAAQRGGRVDEQERVERVEHAHRREPRRPQPPQLRRNLAGGRLRAREAEEGV